MLAVLMVACLPAMPEPKRPASIQSGQSGDPLTDIQQECRVRDAEGIGALNARFGPMCNRPTMTAALHLYDWGTRTGEHEALLMGLALSDLCICRTAACDDATRSRVIHDSAGVPKRKERDINAAAAGIMTDFSSHSCLSATVATELFASGVACGYSVGLGEARMERLRQRIESQLIEVGLDQLEAAKLSTSCTKLE